jgi:HTH-type transcriptional dual regulator CecR, C-terminal domain
MGPFLLARELRNPGPALEILYANLWRPGVEITARLIACILGKPENHPAERIQALLLISSVLVFQSGAACLCALCSGRPSGTKSWLWSCPV